MKILFDQGVPHPLRKFFANHEVRPAYEMGWATLTNGRLLQSAEDEHFECFVTTDKNLSYQQNLSSRKIAIVVLPTPAWPVLKIAAEKIAAAVESSRPSGFKTL